MGRSEKVNHKSLTRLPSPSHSFSSSSSSDFEFTISLSPHKASSNICPADELFYKGQLLPLHLSPRLSMARTLLLASSSTSSSSDTTTTASRDSTGSSYDSRSSFSTDLVLLAECDSSRPSSVTQEDEFKRLGLSYHSQSQQIKKPKYFSSVKEVIRKYLKKVKPLYEKISQKKQLSLLRKIDGPGKDTDGSGKDREISSNARKDRKGAIAYSFSGNLRYPRKRNYGSSCPSSIRSSPSHSGVLCGRAVVGGGGVRGTYYSDSSSMEELQNAIQGAIAHCKNSMLQNKTAVASKDL